jgi:hypothetical protein
MNYRKTVILLNLIAINLSCLVFVSCNNKSMNGMVIITQVTGNRQDANYITGDSWRYIPQARIVALDKDNLAKPIIVLTKDFYSANSPEISFDGKYMIFSAQQKESDPWQIWEMNLDNRKSRNISSCKENCTDPAYLPSGRMIFSKLSVNDSLKAGHSLYTCDLDGSNVKRITFNPHAYFASTILKDGRVLTIDKKLFPDQGDQIFEVLRPDGTKAEMFYKGIEGSALKSRGWETINGKLVFIESGTSGKKAGDVISINYNRPLHTRVNLTGDIKGDFHSVFPISSGKLLVSYRKSEAERYALYEFDPEKKLLGQAVCSNKDYDALEVVVVAKHERPKKLPSEVDTGVKTGLLLCQDVNFLDLHSAGNASSHGKASRIEVIGIDSSLGIVQVEDDGSFYLKVMADKPFRIQTIDNSGHVLQGPCDWIWLRPNERRGCVGCHEDQEMVPENRIPLSVKKPPVVMPVHINKVVEKKISLE